MKPVREIIALSFVIWLLFGTEPPLLKQLPTQVYIVPAKTDLTRVMKYWFVEAQPYFIIRHKNNADSIPDIIWQWIPAMPPASRRALKIRVFNK